MIFSRILLPVFLVFTVLSCADSQAVHSEKAEKYLSGNEQLFTLTDSLKNKRLAITANHASTVHNVPLLDTMLSAGLDVVRVFSPEHGFRGTNDAGETVESDIDIKTGIPIVSLYGNNYKPKQEGLAGIDAVIFDLQDVGVRFYTYLSTLHYMMEACAENAVELWVLDKANPHAHYVDGPVMEEKYTSFLGLHPVPLVYGMTIGEYARMINGEGWLKDGIRCNLKVVACKNYNRQMLIEIDSKPSPNLPNMQSILLYPSLGLFEGTSVNAGRGTDAPFQQYGHPSYSDTAYAYTPVSITGASKNPKHKNVLCFGKNLQNISQDTVSAWNHINLTFLFDAYRHTETETFFTYGFNAHAGNAVLQQQIEEGLSEKEIRESWQPAIDSFLIIRNKYLMYP